jgi:cytoskeletal protein RodZ
LRALGRVPQFCEEDMMHLPSGAPPKEKKKEKKKKEKKKKKRKTRDSTKRVCLTCVLCILFFLWWTVRRGFSFASWLQTMTGI